MQPGRFITVEGGEGVGKSSQLEVVRATLSAAGYTVLVTREPGGTARAEQIRNLLLTPGDEPMPQLCELLLVFAARASHVENAVRPALARGTWVVCDRFTDATYAYQGAGRGIARDHIETLERMVQRQLRPDLTLLLDAPVELAMRRAQKRNAEQGNAAGDRFERERLEFFERVRAGYLDIARQHTERVRVVDASVDMDMVSDRVRTTVTAFMQGQRL
jgi:dTMP kinase